MENSSAKREFRLENEYRYNRSGPVRWIISHVLRARLFPLATVLMAAVNNSAFSYRQVLVGEGFDLITTPGWLLPCLGMGGEILLTDRDHLPEKRRLIFDLADGAALAVNFWAMRITPPI